MFLAPELLIAVSLSAGQPATGAAFSPQRAGRPFLQQSPTPAAAAPSTGPISGYMDFHYNHPVDTVNGLPPPILDFHRFVLLFSHRFSDKLRFVGELELEHALVEGGEESGELELEQAYVDFLVRPALNFRAGMVLVPVGIINERHEPPVFHGVERPFVDTFIVPTTWFDTGVGITGNLGRGFRYRTYAMAPLDASMFTAEAGIADSAQHGSEAIASNLALTGRLEHVGIRGLQAGISFWTGDTSFAVPSVDSHVGLIEFDARFARARLETRAQFARIFIRDAGNLNLAIERTTGVNPNVAEQLQGAYLEAAYRVLPASFPHDAALFVRYENFDTQYRMPTGFTKLPEFDRDAWIIGATYWVDPDVAIKFDYSHVRNKSVAVPAPRSINIGLGWWF